MEDIPTKTHKVWEGPCVPSKLKPAAPFGSPRNSGGSQGLHHSGLLEVVHSASRDTSWFC